MAMSKFRLENISDAVIYYNETDAKTEYPIKGVKHHWSLLEIVRNRISRLNVDAKIIGNNEKLFNAYLTALDREVGNGIPYNNNFSITNEQNITSMMGSIKNMIPIDNLSLEEKCRTVLKKVSQGADLSVSKGLICAEDRQECRIDEFTLMQVMDKGYCIELIPTFIEFYGVVQGTRVLWVSTSETSASIKYKQMRYTLNRGHVIEAMKMLEAEENCVDLVVHENFSIFNFWENVYRNNLLVLFLVLFFIFNIFGISIKISWST